MRPEGDHFVARLHSGWQNFLSVGVTSAQEQELLLNRSGLPNDLASKQLERLLICAKHRHDMGKTGIGVGHANTRCTLTGRGNSRREMQLTSSCQVSEPSSTPRPHLLINILSKHFFRAEFYNDLSKSKIKEKIVIWIFKYFEEITPFRSVEHRGGLTEVVQSGIRISIVVL